MVAMLHLHPSLERYVRKGNVLVVEHLKEGVGPGYGELIGTLEYQDSFGNRCSRFVAPQGLLRLSGTSTIDVEGTPELARCGCAAGSYSRAAQRGVAVPAAQPVLRGGSLYTCGAGPLRLDEAGMGAGGGHPRLGA